MKAVVAAFNQEKALVGAFSVITNLRMELFGALTAAQQNHEQLPRRRQTGLRGRGPPRQRAALPHQPPRPLHAGAQQVGGPGEAAAFLVTSKLNECKLAFVRKRKIAPQLDELTLSFCRQISFSYQM